jgi:hypothetical protein
MIALALLLATSAQPAAEAPAAPAPVLHAGTRVMTRTLEPLSSRTAAQGQRFRLRVVAPVLVDGLIVIPAGAEGVGEVRLVDQKGMMGKSGRLQIAPLWVEVGGARILLDGAAGEKGESNVGPVVIGLPLVGPAAGFISGKHAVIPVGTPLEGRVHADLPLRRAQ